MISKAKRELALERNALENEKKTNADLHSFIIQWGKRLQDEGNSIATKFIISSRKR